MLKHLVQVAAEELEYGLAALQYRAGGGGHPLRTVLVNGSPKTGTTWTLRMVSSVPGYHRIDNFNGAIQRYWDVSPGNVIHGHDRYTPELWDILSAKDVRVLLTIRDPRDQTVSRLFHVRRDTGHQWHQKFRSMNQDEALMACIEGRPGLPGAFDMVTLTQSWLKEEGKALALKYETMLQDPVGQFERILDYLQIKAPARMPRIIVARNRFERLSVGRKIWQTGRKPGQQNTTSHFRKGISGDWKNHFTAAHIARFKEVAGQTLIDLGYEPDLNW